MTDTAVHTALAADGYAVHPALLTADEVEVLRRCFDRLREEGAPTSAQVLYTHAAPPPSRPSFDRLMVQWMNPHGRTGPGGTSTILARVGTRVASLGFDLRVFQDALLRKSADHARFPWHQDEPFWPFDAEAGLVVWCALDPVDRTNGGVELARGSHLFGRGPAIDLHTGEPQAGLPGTLPSPAALVGECPVLLPGDAVLFRPRTWHGSGRNTSGAPRRGWSSSWVPSGTVVSPELAPRHPLARQAAREGALR